MPKRWSQFGALLRRNRLQADMSLREFAEKMQLSPTYISRVENGHIAPPTEKRIKDMAQLLNIPRDGLLTAAGKVDPDLVAYIRRTEALPAFLRAARDAGLANADFEAFTKQLHKRKK